VCLSASIVGSYTGLLCTHCYAHTNVVAMLSVAALVGLVTQMYHGWTDQVAA